MERRIPLSCAAVYALLLLAIPAVFSGRVCDEGTRVCADVCCCQYIRHSAMGTGTKAVCSHRSLTGVPHNLPQNTIEIDLTFNNISSLPGGAFSRLPNLRTLVLMSNQLKSLGKDVFRGLTKLEVLNLRLNWFQHAPGEAFHKDLANLGRLHLDSNWISSIHDDTFINLSSLYHLSLEKNKLSAVPMRALGNIPTLEVLLLDFNQISALPQQSFVNNPRLAKLYISHNNIERIAANSFARLPHLTELVFRSNPIVTIEHTAFRGFPSLQKLEIVAVKNLSVFPDLTGTYNLKDLVIERCSLRRIPEDFCYNRTALRTLNLHNNQLESFPRTLSHCSELQLINFAINRLTSLEGRPFAGLKELYDLSLNYNSITSVPADALEDLVNLNTLTMGHNAITHIDSQAFAACTRLEKLNLRSNFIPVLPTAGLGNLVTITTFENEPLENFPSPSELPNIYEIETAYAYHCCEYLDLMEKHRELLLDQPTFKEETIWNSDYPTDVNQTFPSDLWASDLAQFSFLYSTMTFLKGPSPGPYVNPPHNISCKPKPGPFLPCVDLFGSWPLRIGVWLVFTLAIIGNAIVIFVILVSHTKMTVPRFLICNLAFADFFLGIYLSFLAGVDASTHGSFRKYGANWQLSAGCKMAGFLAVFSSEFSIYTLSVITLERFYAIKHALHLEKRMKLPHAVTVMGFGMVFSIICATLPLVNVSHYHKFPVCLPFDVTTTVAKVYVVGLLALNILAFVVIMACYASIYLSIQGSHAWNCNDSRVARRMSLLVFTDFACWAPITFFSITSALGLKLISLNGAKVLTIFVLPLNSCANPFLYTILTKQFKKDCRMILRTLSNRVFRQRSMSRSITLSLGRHPSMRSTQAHQTSQLRWRTNGSISQDVTGDPCLVSFKTENGEPSSNVYTVANFITADSQSTQITSIGSPCLHDHSPSDSCTMLDPMPSNVTLDDPRRGSRSPLLDLISQVRSKTQDYKPKSKLRRKFSIPIPFFLTRSPSKAAGDGSSQHSSKNSPLGQRHKRSHSVTEGLLHKMGRKKPLTSMKSAPGITMTISRSSEQLVEVGNGHIGANRIVIPHIEKPDRDAASQGEEDEEAFLEAKAFCDPWQLSPPLPDETFKDQIGMEAQCLLQGTTPSGDPDPSKGDATEVDEAERLLRSSHDNPVRDQLSSTSPSPLLHRPDDLNLDTTQTSTNGNQDCDSGLGTASSPLPESTECMKFLPEAVHQPYSSRDLSNTESPKTKRQASALGGMLVQRTKSDPSKCFNEEPSSPTKGKLLCGPKESVV